MEESDIGEDHSVEEKEVPTAEEEVLEEEAADRGGYRFSKLSIPPVLVCRSLMFKIYGYMTLNTGGRGLIKNPKTHVLRYTFHVNSNLENW